MRKLRGLCKEENEKEEENEDNKKMRKGENKKFKG